MSYAIDFAPHLPMALLWTASVAALAICLYAIFTGARGGLMRLLAFAFLLLALANPLFVHETREPLPDIVALLVDHSPSMDIRGRKEEADKAAAELKAALQRDKTLEIREAVVQPPRAGEDTGTQLFATLRSALADAPPDRLAGAIAVTDGQVHDVPAQAPIKAPFHALIVDQKNERDRKLTVVSATRYAIVGQTADVTLRVDDFGSSPGGSAAVDIEVDGHTATTRMVPVGRPAHLEIPITHAGENVVELSARPGPAELTLENNRAVVVVNGVRDRLRVLLISGEPNASERVWRDLLKSDPSVDLVHFTILRPPQKQAEDPTPLNELSLIVFPTPELFGPKLDSFDLVIFDRYSERGILLLGYYENIVRYVQNGGALLVSGGPEFAGPASIFHTPLASVLPARPTGDVVTGGFKPVVTPQGLAHPVTRDLTGSNTDGKPPSWGRWFRIIGADKISGETLMSGPNDRPLLVLDRVGKGRVAELLSDQIWLWARGFEGGGPQAELLRKFAHWLMKEPELEEERLSASIDSGLITVERQTMAEQPKPVMLTYPSGKHVTMQLVKVEPGMWRGTAKADELGLYRLTDGTLNTVTATGPLNPKEVADMRATDAVLKPVANATGGSVRWLSDGGIPKIRRVSPGSSAAGDSWIGLKKNGAYRVTSVEQTPLFPPWLALLLVVGTFLFAWRREGR
ncbi:MAG TPA: hypothetical protein VMU22_12945 [Rhizomicrobium sp.]|nr:hypothetical protein [Rhizomicrobium sp.]